MPKLRPDPRNARRHSEKQIGDIASSIERFGFVNPIAIRPNGMIIGGHGTLDAVKRIGWADVDVRVVDGLTEAQYRALALALNRLPENSQWDDTILGEVLGELREVGEERGLGFADKEIARIMSGEPDLEVKEVETSMVADEFWISIRGPLAQQADTFKRLEQALAGVTGVTIDIGTIALGQ